MAEKLVQEKAPLGVRAKDIARRIFRHENAVLGIILVVIVAVLGVMSGGKSVTRSNIINVILQSSTRGMAAIGQAFVILTAGIDLSVGGLSIMTMIIGAKLMQGVSEYTLFYEPQAANPTNPFLGILIMLLIGAAVGAGNGLATSRIGMPSLIVTLAVWRITLGSALVISEGKTLGNLPSLIHFVGQGRIAGIPVPVIIFIVSGVIAYFVLHHTSFGRAVYAVGGNPVSAWLSGIKVKRTLLSVFVISGVTASIAGLIIMGRMGSASLAASGNLELDSIAATVIGGVSLMGGRGTVIGAIIGAIILGVIQNGMNIMNVDPALQGIVLGVIIFAAVAIDYLRRR